MQVKDPWSRMSIALGIVTLLGGHCRVLDGEDTGPSLTETHEVLIHLHANCPGHNSAVSAVAVSPDGKLAVSAGDRQTTLRFWDTETGKELAAIRAVREPGQGEWIGKIAFSPDGTMLAASVVRQRVRMWNVATREEITGRYNIDWGYSLAFSPDGSKLGVTGRSLPKAAGKIWNLVEKRSVDLVPVIHELTHADSIQFSPDGSLIGAAFSGGPYLGVKAWNVKTGKEVFRSYKDSIASTLAFAPDSKSLATTGGDERGLIEIWNLSTTKLVSSFEADKKCLFSLAYNPKGHLLASGGSEKAIKLWNADSFRLIAELKGHTDQVLDLAWSADGQTLVSAGRDGRLLIWRSGRR